MDRDHVDHLLEQWAAERPELDTRPLAVAARVARLERILARVSEAALADVPLSVGEGNVLAALRRAGPPYQLTPSELVASLLTSSAGMTGRIDRLEEAGYVERVADPADRRRVHVRLTPAGRELIDRSMDAHVAALAAALPPLSPGDHDALVDLLRTVLVALERSEP